MTATQAKIVAYKLDLTNSSVVFKAPNCTFEFVETVGEADGCVEGSVEGWVEGAIVGCEEGCALGPIDGNTEG